MNDMNDELGEKRFDRRSLAAMVGIAIGGTVVAGTVGHPDSAQAAGTSDDDQIADLINDLASATHGAMDDGYVSRGPRVFHARDWGLLVDGSTDDLAALNTLIIAAGVLGGGTILFPPGVVILNGRINLTSNITLEGAGRLHTTLKCTHPSSQLTYAGAMSGITIRRMLFDGGTSNQGATVSLTFDGCTDLLIEDCRFVNTRQTIWFLDESGPSARAVIQNNFFDTVVDEAVRLDARPDADSITIQNNHVAGVTSVSPDGTEAAFRIRGTHHRVRDNIIDGSIDTGIMVAGSGTADIVVSGNVVVSKRVGIFVGTSVERVVVANNNIASLTDFGIHLYDDSALSEVGHTVTGNVIHDCGKCGIAVEGVRGFALTGNTITNCASHGAETNGNWRGGISVTATSNGSCQNYAITGNTIRDNKATPTMYHGIRIESEIINVNVIGNAVSGSLEADYYLSPTRTAPYYIQTNQGITSAFTA